MLLRRFRTYINQSFTLEEGRPLIVKLFGWLIPRSKFLDGKVLSCDDGPYMLVRVGRRDLLVSRSFEHPDYETCDSHRDPDCGHWQAQPHQIGDPVTVMLIPPAPEHPSDIYIELSRGPGLHRAAA